MDITEKKISILGAVRSGIGAAKLAKRNNAFPFVSDCAPRAKLERNIITLETDGINYETDAHTDKVYDCDFIITSPGIPSDSEVLRKAKNKNIPVYSELEFASWFCKGIIIAISGTNGKTTSTALCAHVLNECGIKTYAAGNIGLAFSEVAHLVKEEEFVSLEVSSFQLDFIKTFKPKFSLLLNITPDHLDRYEHDFSKYIKAKLNIVRNQDETDYFICWQDDKNIPAEIYNDKVKKYSFSLVRGVENGAFFKDGKMWYSKKGKVEEVCAGNELSIKGEHNIANALAVLTIAKILNLPNEKIRKAFSNFPGVEHRLELVKEINRVQYINDSKATNVDSVWYALSSFDKPIYLILGGKDKGNDYNRIKDLAMKHVKKIYAIGVSAQKVYDFFKDVIETEKVESLEECVNLAKQEAEPNTIVLLSPACASFDMFEDYEHRGNVFKEAVKRI